MIRTNVYLTRVQKDRLKRLGAAEGYQSSELIRRAIDEFLEKEQKRLSIKLWDEG